MNSSLADHTPLNERPEWLSARDLMEVFGIGRTRATEVIDALPHIYVGALTRRVHRSTLAAFVRDHQRLPYKGEFDA